MAGSCARSQAQGRKMLTTQLYFACCCQQTYSEKLLQGFDLKRHFLKKKKKRQASKQANSISQAFVTSAPSAKMLSGFPVCILNYKHSLSFSNNKTLIITFIRHCFQTVHTLIDSDMSLPAPLEIDNIKKHKSLEK